MCGNPLEGKVLSYRGDSLISSIRVLQIPKVDKQAFFFSFSFLLVTCDVAILSLEFHVIGLFSVFDMNNMQFETKSGKIKISEELK